LLCYFERAPGKHRDDVSSMFECGPVLSYASVPSGPWLSIPIASQAGSTGHVTLRVPTAVSLLTSALPVGARLERPDRRTPPNGTGGLTVPVAPAGQPDLFARVSPNAMPQSTQAPQGALLGTYGATV
jgi:hypothetical protein